SSKFSPNQTFAPARCSETRPSTLTFLSTVIGPSRRHGTDQETPVSRIAPPRRRSTTTRQCVPEVDTRFSIAKKQNVRPHRQNHQQFRDNNKNSNVVRVRAYATSTRTDGMR
ncbi:unnamed protein product, partial [Ectocarpus sp. 12 AP-2014]